MKRSGMKGAIQFSATDSIVIMSMGYYGTNSIALKIHNGIVKPVQVTTSYSMSQNYKNVVYDNSTMFAS
jgi:hypothetical protein